MKYNMTWHIMIYRCTHASMHVIFIGTWWQSFSDGMLTTNLHEKTYPSNGRSISARWKKLSKVWLVFQMRSQCFASEVSWFYPWFTHVYPASLAMRQCLPDDQGYGWVAVSCKKKALHELRGTDGRNADSTRNPRIRRDEKRGVCRAIWLISGSVLRDPWEWFLAKHYKNTPIECMAIVQIQSSKMRGRSDIFVFSW